MSHTTPIAVTIQEACRLVGLGRSRMYEEIGAGRIDACKSGTRTLVLVASLQAYVAELPPYRHPTALP